MNGSYHPRFKEMMNAVVATGRCAECASCVTVCPYRMIEYVDGHPRLTDPGAPSFDYCRVSETRGCDVCAAICPRLWPNESDLRDAVFGDGTGWEGVFGVYRHVFVARARRPHARERGQDGGVVTALLAWARETGRIDGAVVAAVADDDRPCFPSPRLATTVDEIEASAGSWYTYCPNALALQQAKTQQLERVAFVGVPCQITPVRKMSCVDSGVLLDPRKNAPSVTHQLAFLRGLSERVAFRVGLFCTEVFRPELMTERIAGQMGIALSDIEKFNVKGEVLIHRKNGETARIPLEEAMNEYQRPACAHCTDFSAELADISCGGIGTDRATVVVLRTQVAVDLWREFEASGQVEVWPIAEHRKAWNILQRLARKQRERVPQAAGAGSAYSPASEAGLGVARLADLPDVEIDKRVRAAYAGAPRPMTFDPRPRPPIPGDPGEPMPGAKRSLPPPPGPEHGGASPCLQPCCDDIGR